VATFSYWFMRDHNSLRCLTGSGSAASDEPKATTQSAARACQAASRNNGLAAQGKMLWTASHRPFRFVQVFA